MSVSSQSLIVLQEAINYFNSRVSDIEYSASYYSGYYPSFSGSAPIGRRSDENLDGTSTIQNPIAIPSGQLSSRGLGRLNLNGGIITANTLWNSMISIASSFNKIRRFSSTWKNKYDTNWVHIGTTSGTAAFNTSFPSVPTSNDVLNGPSYNWSRSGGSNVYLSPSHGNVSSGNLISASGYISAVDSCYNEWRNRCYNSNTIYYTLYTCHANCHDVCHTNRGRR